MESTIGILKFHSFNSFEILHSWKTSESKMSKRWHHDAKDRWVAGKMVLDKWCVMGLIRLAIILTPNGFLTFFHFYLQTTTTICNWVTGTLKWLRLTIQTLLVSRTSTSGSTTLQSARVNQSKPSCLNLQSTVKCPIADAMLAQMTMLSGLLISEDLWSRCLRRLQ